MLDALAEHFPREAEWTHPQGGLFIWATLPDYIDTTDLLARALQEHVAFVPGRAAYVDGRGGSSMRLNFSGVDEDADPRGRSAGSARSCASRWRCTARSPARAPATSHSQSGGRAGPIPDGLATVHPLPRGHRAKRAG